MRQDPKDQYVIISRKFFQSSLWLESQPFSRACAWIDLIQLAQWRDKVYETRRFGRIELKRGEFVASGRRLAKRWGWSKHKVCDFLEEGQRQGRISAQRKGRAGTVYLIVNYDVYQHTPGKKDQQGAQLGARPGDQEQYRDLPNARIRELGAAATEPSSTATEPSSLDILPKSVVDQCLAKWGQFGGVNYTRLRTALLECVQVGIKADLLPDAIDVYAEWIGSLDPREQRFNTPTPERFAQQAAWFAQLGQEPIYDDKNELTRRGALLHRGIPA